MRVAIVLAAAWVVVSFAWVTAHRVTFGGELEWLEGGTVEHVARVLHGHAIYTAPSVDYVPYGYPPVYYWVSAIVAKITTFDVRTLRGVSLAASVGTIAAIYWLVRRETGERWAGVLAAGTYTCTFGVTRFFDNARVDALSVALIVAGLIAIRYAKRTPHVAAAGALMALATLTKQTAGPIALAIVVYLTCTRRRHALVYAAAFVAVLGTISLALDLRSHGWFRYYVFELYLQHKLLRRMVGLFWTSDILKNVGVVFLLACGWFVLAVVRRRDIGPPVGLYGAALAGALVSSWLSRIHDGGANNVVMPAYALIAIAGSIGAATLAAAIRRPGPSALAQLAVGTLVVVQLVSHTAVVFNALPRPGSSAATARFRARIAAVDGDVYIPNNTLYAFLAHKRMYADDVAAGDVLRSHDASGRAKLRASIDDAIRRHQFAVIVQDGDAPTSTVVDAGYECSLIADSHELRPVDEFLPPRWFCVSP